MEQPAAPAAARHGHNGGNVEHPGGIPPALASLAGHAGRGEQGRPRKPGSPANSAAKYPPGIQVASRTGPRRALPGDRAIILGRHGLQDL